MRIPLAWHAQRHQEIYKGVWSVPRKQNKEPQTRRTLTTSLSTKQNMGWHQYRLYRMVKGYSVDMVIINQFRKYNHFIPLAHPYTTTITAKKLMGNIFKLHGIPQSIVSDKDVIFTSFSGKKYSICVEQGCWWVPYTIPKWMVNEQVVRRILVMLYQWQTQRLVQITSLSWMVIQYIGSLINRT